MTLDVFNIENELDFAKALEEERLAAEAEFFSSLDEVSSFIINHAEYETNDNDWLVPPTMKADERHFMKALMRTLSHEQLENLQNKNLLQEPLIWDAKSLLERDSKVQKAAVKNEPIATLLDEFVTHKKGRRNFVRAQLQNRFDAQDNDIQVGIFRAFLQGGKNDRRWCYNKALSWWSDCIIPEMEKIWEAYKEPNCARVVSERLPLTYVKQHQEDLGKADYHNLCLRLGTEEDFAIDRKRLGAVAFFHVLTHCNRNISDTEADLVVFEYLAEVLTSGYFPHHYSMKYENSLFRPEEIPDNYRPSLLFIKGMDYVLWCLGQLGKSNTIMKLYSWNKMLQQQMPKYMAIERIDKPHNHNENLNEDYLKKNWVVFVIHAILTFPIKNTKIEAFKTRVRKKLNDAHLPIEEEIEKMAIGESPVFQYIPID